MAFTNVVTNTDVRLGNNEYEKGLTILTGQDLAKGSVLGIVTASGKLKLTDKASSDGSEVAKYVLQTALNTSATGLNADTTYDVIKSGKVRADKLVFGGASVVADHREQLRDYGILVEDVETIGLD